MNFKNFDFKNNLFIRNNPVYKEAKKESILIGSGNSSTYKKEAIRKANIASKYFMPITYTPIYTKKLGQAGHSKINLKSKKLLGVIYNTSFYFFWHAFKNQKNFS